MDKTVRHSPRRRVTKIALVASAAAAALALASCGMKASEPFRDADRGATNSAPADVIEMPDGFSNLATKCDHGNRIYVIFKGDDLYGSIAVSPQDPSCK